MEGEEAGAEYRNSSTDQSCSAGAKSIRQHASGKLTDRIGSSKADQAEGQGRDSGSRAWANVFAADIVARVENPRGKKDLRARRGERFLFRTHKSPLMAVCVTGKDS